MTPFYFPPPPPPPLALCLRKSHNDVVVGVEHHDSSIPIAGLQLRRCWNRVTSTKEILEVHRRLNGPNVKCACFIRLPSVKTNTHPSFIKQKNLLLQAEFAAIAGARTIQTPFFVLKVMALFSEGAVKYLDHRLDS